MRRNTLLALSSLVALAACGGVRQPSVGRVHEPGSFLSCVPYARALSGIGLRGDAHTWWDGAEGIYERGTGPRIGSVLVFARTSRLRSGHLSVVTRVVSAREVRVTHANWASGGDRGRVHEDAPVVDVSPWNDWSQVRVWHAPSDTLGVTVFPVYGFIHSPDHPTEAELARRIRPAMTLAAR